MSELLTQIDPNSLAASLFSPSIEQVRVRDEFIGQTLGAVALERLRFCMPVLRSSAHETAEDIYFDFIDTSLVRPPKQHAWRIESYEDKEQMMALQSAIYCGFSRGDRIHSIGLSPSQHDLAYRSLVSYVRACNSDSGWLDGLFTVAQKSDKPFQQPNPNQLAAKLDDSFELENRLQAIGATDRSIVAIVALFLKNKDRYGVAEEYGLNYAYMSPMLRKTITRLEEHYGSEDEFLDRTIKTLMRPRGGQTRSRPKLTKEEKAIARKAQKVIDTPKQEREKLLIAEEEVQLAKEIECGLYAKHLLESAAPARYSDEEMKDLTEVMDLGEASFWRFVRANIGLAYMHVLTSEQVLRFWGLWSRENIDDIAATLVSKDLVLAVQKFDFTRGYKFSVYARDWLQRGVHMEMAKRMPIEINYHAFNLMWRIRKYVAQIQAEKNHTPSVDELSDHFSVNTSRIVVLMDTYESIRKSRSLHQHIRSQKDGTVYEEMFSDPNQKSTEQLALGIGAEKAEDHLVGLTGQQRFIIAHDIQLDDRPKLTDQELAKRLNRTTVNRVRILRQKALAILKAQILAD